jgi:hypothetical protein
MGNDVPKLNIKRAETYAPFHDFKESELERLRQKWDTWPVGKPREFDEKECLQTAVKARKDQWNNWVGQPILETYAKGWNEKDGVLSREEATFWFELLGSDGYFNGNWGDELKQKDIKPRVGKLDPNGDFKTFTDYFDSVVGNGYIYQSHYTLVRLMRDLFDHGTVLEWLFKRFPGTQVGPWLWGFGPIAEEHRDQALKLVVNMLATYDFTTAQYYDLNTNIPQLLHRVPWDTGIEGIVGEYVRRKNQAWQTTVVDLIYKLDDEHKAEDFIKKIKFSSEPKDVRRAFAWGGFEQVEILFKHVVWRNNGYNLNASFKEALKVRHPDVVLWLAHYWGKKAVVDGMIEQYMEGEGAHVVKGLVRLCARRGRKRDWAIEWLRRLKDNGDGELIEAMLEGEKDLAIKLVREEVLDHEEVVVPDLPDSKLTKWMGAVSGLEWPREEHPAWFTTSDMGQVIMADGEHALPEAIVEGLLRAAAWAYPTPKLLKGALGYKDPRNDKFQKNHEATRHAAQKALKQAKAELFEPDSYEHFVLALFEKWDHDNIGEADDWVIELAATSHTPAVADALDHYIRSPKEYPESRRQKPCVLRAISALGTVELPSARRDLVYISEHSQQTDYTNRAKSVLEAIKKRLKVDDDEFADLAVPSFGLDARGRRTFDYGPRQFTFIVKGRGEVTFYDEDEDRYFEKIPPGRKTDDRELVKVARAEYKLMRQPVMEVFAEQAQRMERAMLIGRAWKSDRWREYIVRHPVLGHIARRLVWKIFEPDGTVVARVMLDEENLLMDLEMEEYTLEPDHHLALVHPVELDGDERQEWTDQLMDFEIIQPFDQMGRDVFTYDDATSTQLIEDAKAGKAHLLNERLISNFSKGWGFAEKSWWWAHKLRLAPGDLEQVVDFHPSSGFSLTRNGKIQTTYGYQNLSDIKFIATADLKKKDPPGIDFADAEPRLFSEVLKLIHDAAQYD